MLKENNTVHVLNSLDIPMQCSVQNGWRAADRMLITTISDLRLDLYLYKKLLLSISALQYSTESIRKHVF